MKQIDTAKMTSSMRKEAVHEANMFHKRRSLQKEMVKATDRKWDTIKHKGKKCWVAS